jgi:hypothetical protein
MLPMYVSNNRFGTLLASRKECFGKNMFWDCAKVNYKHVGVAVSLFRLHPWDDNTSKVCKASVVVFLCRQAMVKYNLAMTSHIPHHNSI